MDQRECQRLGERIDALDGLVDEKTDDIWKELDRLRDLVKGSDMKGGMVGAINRFEIKLDQIQQTEIARSRKEWGIISLIIGQFLYTILKS